METIMSKIELDHAQCQRVESLRDRVATQDAPTDDEKRLFCDLCGSGFLCFDCAWLWAGLDEESGGDHE